MSHQALIDALAGAERECMALVERHRGELTAGELQTLRDACELVGCLRRLVSGRSLSELHAAFGAPGAFGYGTPIGNALARAYWGDRPAAETMAGAAPHEAPAVAGAPIAETLAGMGQKKPAAGP